MARAVHHFPAELESAASVFGTVAERGGLVRALQREAPWRCRDSFDLLHDECLTLYSSPHSLSPVTLISLISNYLSQETFTVPSPRVVTSMLQLINELLDKVSQSADVASMGLLANPILRALDRSEGDAAMCYSIFTKMHTKVILYYG